jgi:hypothetical protein
MPKVTDTKKELIGFKGTTSEKEFLIKCAEKNGMNLSQYMRARLLEDEVNMSEEIGQKQLTQIELDLIKSSLGSYNLINSLVHKSLTEEELEKAHKKTTDLLEKRGYKLPENNSQD